MKKELTKPKPVKWNRNRRYKRSKKKKKRFLPRPPIQLRRVRKFKSAVHREKLLTLQILRTKEEIIEYKNLKLLKKCVTDKGKILPKRINRITAKQQRYIAKAIKNARIIGLLPFTGRSEKLTNPKEIDQNIFSIKPQI